MNLLLPGVSLSAPNHFCLFSDNGRFYAALDSDGVLRIFLGYAGPSAIGPGDFPPTQVSNKSVWESLWDPSPSGNGSGSPPPGETWVLELTDDGLLHIKSANIDPHAPTGLTDVIWESIPPEITPLHNVYGILQDDGYLCLYDADTVETQRNPPATLGTDGALWSSDSFSRWAPEATTELIEDYRSLIVVGIALFPEVGAIVDFFVIAFWPQESVWDEIKAEVEALIQHDIAASVWSERVSDLKGLRDALADYRSYAKAFRSNPHDDGALLDSFVDTNSTFARKLENFKVDGYQDLLLPLYLQVVILHSGLLREGILLGKTFGATDVILENWRTELDELIATSIAYVNHTLAGSRRPPIKSYDSAYNWNYQNGYDRYMRLKVKDPLAVLPYLAPGSGSPPPPDPEEIFSDAFGLADNWQYPYGTPPTPSPAPGSWLSSLEIHGTSGLLYPCGCTLTYQDGTQVTQGHAPADSDGSAAFSGGSPVSGLEFSTVNVTVAESVDSNSGWVPRLESYVSSVQFGPFDPVSLSVHSLVKTSPPTSKGILGTSFSPTEYPGAVAGHPILQYAMVSYDGYILSSVHVWMGSQRWNDDGFGSTWIFGFRRADSKF